MKTNKELLELAARAAGLSVEPCVNGWDEKYPLGWNPINNDGDAFRLAVTLKIHYRQYKNATIIRNCLCADGYVEAVHKDVEEREPIKGDAHAATRLAIVRAAAQIGENMVKKD